jgi:hypothetical protein
LYRESPLDQDFDLAEQHRLALLDIIDTAKFAPTESELANGKHPGLDDRSSLNLQSLFRTDQDSRGLERLVFDNNETRNPGLLFDWPFSRPLTRSMIQAASAAELDKERPESALRLHALYGITMRERRENRYLGRARRKIYNWNLTNDSTDYAPFLKDGSGKVNWNLLEGARSGISRNFEYCVDGRISLPHGMSFAIPHRTLSDPTTPNDWARVQGSWLGTYAFIDYSDLLAFNTAHNPPELTNEPEACGALLRTELKLDPSVKDDPKLRTKVPMSSDLPPLYFSGVSRGQGQLLATVKGFAALVIGGREVRWKFVVAHQGVNQWQLEGVQPGGVRSGGIFGVWSQVDHDFHGPLGPFCYFPMELCKPTTVAVAT